MVDTGKLSVALLLKRIEMESQWGLDHSHLHGNYRCNACRALEVVIVITRQARGETVPNPVNLDKELFQQG
jgi:hypothetical protein